MMVAMKEIDKLLAGFAFRFHMEEEAVSDVLKKRPEEDASSKEEDGFDGTEGKGIDTMIDKIGNHRQVHRPDQQRMSFREPFQGSALKQPGLT